MPHTKQYLIYCKVLCSYIDTTLNYKKYADVAQCIHFAWDSSDFNVFSGDTVNLFKGPLQ